MRSPRPEYLPAYLSSGLLGVRVGTVPLLEGVAVVSGLRGMDPEHGVEAFARGPYPFAGDIEVNGHRLSRLPGNVTFREQAYDFGCGELRTRFEFHAGDVTAAVEVLTLCSRSLPLVTLQEVRVRTDRACSLQIRGGVNHAGVPGRVVSRRADRREGEAPAHGSLLMDTHGALSQCGAAYATWFSGAADWEEGREIADDLAPLWTGYSGRARANRTYVLHQLCALVPTAFHSQPDLEARRLISIAANRGFDTLRRENAEAWAEIWRGRVVIDGAGDRWQGIVDAAFYYLHASAHRSSLFSTAMFGLAYWPNYHYYYGHVMWDIETFALPPLLLTAPETAGAMLDYRFLRLAAARRNAAMHGAAGAQFPWESSAELGEEATPTAGALVGMEEHVNFSVASGFARYWYVTGDHGFAHEKAWPVVRDVARWVASRARETSRGYEILGTIGIAEDRASPVDNNAYVNMAAAVALDDAVAVARHVGAPTERWEEIARRMVVPVNPRTKVILNHDGFTAREGGVTGATPEALAGLFPAGYRAPEDVVRATLAFYLGRIEPYIGFPMLSAPLGVWAARVGDRKRSAELFEAGYAEFITDPYREANEFSNVRFPDKPRVGPLFANVGGFLTSLMYGLPRVEPRPGEPETWLQGPITMPAGWRAIEIERVWVRGEAMRLVARHGGERAELVPKGGP